MLGSKQQAVNEEVKVLGNIFPYCYKKMMSKGSWQKPL